MQDNAFPSFTRETYKAVKKMDREQMETFFRNVIEPFQKMENLRVSDLRMFRQLMERLRKQ